jgi:hypothetical protein
MLFIICYLNLLSILIEIVFENSNLDTLIIDELTNTKFKIELYRTENQINKLGIGRMNYIWVDYWEKIQAESIPKLAVINFQERVLLRLD